MMARGPRPADVAHALRTPLNAIQAWTFVLEGHLGEADPGARRALEGIRAGVEEQARLIGELLERPTPRTNSGKPEPGPER